MNRAVTKVRLERILAAGIMSIVQSLRNCQGEGELGWAGSRCSGGIHGTVAFVVSLLSMQDLDEQIQCEPELSVGVMDRVYMIKI